MPKCDKNASKHYCVWRLLVGVKLNKRNRVSQRKHASLNVDWHVEASDNNYQSACATTSATVSLWSVMNCAVFTLILLHCRCLVSTRSKIFAPRVGSDTHCCRFICVQALRNCITCVDRLSIFGDAAAPSLRCQAISGKLKSPTNNN